MTLATADIALRAASVALLLLLAASFIRDFRASVAGRLAVAFALGSAAHAATSAIGAALPISGWHAPLIALSTGNVVVFWLFTRALFDDAFVLRLWYALIWLAVAGFSFVNCLWIARAGSVRLAIVAVNLLALGFIVLAVGQMILSWSADLVESRRRLRIFIVSAAALYGGMNAILQIAGTGSGEAPVANTVNAAVLLLIVATISIAMMQVTARDLFPAASDISVAANPPASLWRRLLDQSRRQFWRKVPRRTWLAARCLLCQGHDRAVCDHHSVAATRHRALRRHAELATRCRWRLTARQRRGRGNRQRQPGEQGLIGDRRRHPAVRLGPFPFCISDRI